MLHLLALFIKGKTGLINYYKAKQSNSNELLLLKGLSPDTLDNLRIDTVNSNLKKRERFLKIKKSQMIIHKILLMNYFLQIKIVF